MKQKLLFIAALSGLAISNTYGQQEVKFDFNSDTKLPTTIISVGQPLKIVIENVNRNIFKVETNVKQENLNTERPEILKSMSLPSFLNFALPENTAAVNEALAPSGEKAYIDDLKASLDVVKSSTNEIKKAVVLNNDIKSIGETCKGTFEEVRTKLIERVSIYLPADSPILQPQQLTKVEEVLDKAIDDGIKQKDIIPEKLFQLTKSLKAVIRTDSDLIQRFEKAQGAKTSKVKTPTYEEYIDAKKTVEENTDYIAFLKAECDKALSNITEIEKFSSENKVNDLLNNYRLINASNFKYVIYTPEIEADLITLDLKITSDKPLQCDKPMESYFKKEYFTRGGWKVDFSAGIFINAGNENFLGRELQYKSVDSATVTIQAKDGGKRVLLSVGALAHIYKRSGKNVNWAFSPGLSSSTNFDGLNFHLGGSMLFGRKNRGVITLGVTLREAKILDRNYNYETAYAKKEMPEAPPTIKVFPKAGAFLSFSYNLMPYKTE